MKRQGRSGRPGAAGEVRAGGQGAHFRNIDSIPDPRPAGRGALGFCPAHSEELGTNCWSPLRRRREEAPPISRALGRPDLCLLLDPCDTSVTPSQMTRDSGRTDTQLVRPGPDEDAGLLPPRLPPAAPGLHKSRGLRLPARPGPRPHCGWRTSAGLCPSREGGGTGSLADFGLVPQTRLLAHAHIG